MQCSKGISYATQPKWVSDIVNSNIKWKTIKSFLFKKLEMQIHFLDKVLHRTLHSKTLLCFSYLLAGLSAKMYTAIGRLAKAAYSSDSGISTHSPFISELF